MTLKQSKYFFVKQWTYYFLSAKKNQAIEVFKIVIMQ